MSTLTVAAPPTTDDATEQEETKYTLYRPAGGSGFLPDPGTRRFSKSMMNRAKSLDATFDSYPAQDQSDWDDWRDVYCEASWRKWMGLL